MTAQERFLATMAYEPVDRAPLWEEGIREDVRERWAVEGLPADEPLSARFTYDRREEAGFDLMPRPALSREGDYAELLHRLPGLYEAVDDRLDDGWPDKASAWASRDYTLGLRVWRGFVQPLEIGDFRTLEPAFLALHDHPDAVFDLMEAIADCALSMCDRALVAFTPDYAVFDEPIAGAYGPVVSPEMFRRFCLPHYARLIDALRERGVRWFLVRTYGNPLDLLPVWMEAGINMLWCVEVVDLRRSWGRELRLVSGLDQNLIAAGGDGVRDEFDRVVTPLVADGGYIPLSDGRIRSTVSWLAYRDYREELARRVQGVSQEGTGTPAP